MTDFDRLREIFLEACERPAAERAAFVEERAGGDAELVAELHVLLAANANPNSLVAAPLDVAAEAVASKPTRMPEAVGPYRILGQLGRGGMGIVYRAEQSSPRREVALKVLQPGLVDEQVLKRFAREAEVLGLLEHPGIARIYDAGACDFGYGEMPYFAMELVHGPSLREFADENRLDHAARCTLVARVCDAVQHAHDRGIVHRDLKPSNILVVGDGTGAEGPQPKVLDFGIARTTDATAALSTMQTSTGQLLGTLPYMSPEQLSGSYGEVDGRSDVYSLGVILYELLAGDLPLDLVGRPLTDIGHVVRTVEPTPLGRADKALRGDLETIADKALAKEPERRYARAAELADDLRRFCRHEPIRARPQTTWYQVKKFARRNKVLVGGVTATFTALIAGIAFSLYFLLESKHSEWLAKRDGYAARLTAAAATIDSDPVTAAAALRDAPAELRGWEWRWLQSRLEPASLVFEPPAGEPGAIAYRDGRLLCAAAAGEEVVLYDVELGTVVHRFQAPAGLAGVELSADGALVCMQGEAIVVSDTRTGARVHDSRDATTAMPKGFASDGSRAAHRLPPGVTVAPVRDTTWTKVSPDGRWLLCGHESNAFVWVVEVASGQLVAYLRGHKGLVSTSRSFFSPDSRRVVTASVDDGTTRVWDVATCQCEKIVFDTGSRLAFDPTGSELAVMSGDAVKLFPIGRGEARLELAHPIFVYATAFSPDGALLATGDFAGDVRIWDTRTGRLLGTYDFHFEIEVLDFVEGGRRLLVGSVLAPHYQLYSIDLPSWRARTAAYGDSLTVGSGAVRVRVLYPTVDDRVHVLDASGRSLFGIDVPGWQGDGERVDAVRTRMRGNSTADQRRVAVSSDGARVAVGERDGRVQIWDSTRRAHVETFAAHVGPIYELRFLSDGRLVTAGKDGAVRIWLLEPSRRVAQLPEHALYVHGLAMDADETRIATVSGDMTARIWDSMPAAARRSVTREALAARAEVRGRLLAALREVGDPNLAIGRLQRSSGLSPIAEREVIAAALELLPQEGVAVPETLRREVYAACLCAARGLETKDPPLALGYLDRAPEALRGQEWQWLRARLLRTEHAFARETPAPELRSVAFDAEGRALFAFAKGRAVQVVDVATGASLHAFDAPHEVAGLWLSPSGRRIAVWLAPAEKKRGLQVRELSTGSSFIEIADHAALAMRSGRPWAYVLRPDLSWSPDEGRVAWRHGAALWDVGQGENVRKTPSDGVAWPADVVAIRKRFSERLVDHQEFLSVRVLEGGRRAVYAAYGGYSLIDLDDDRVLRRFADSRVFGRPRVTAGETRAWAWTGKGIRTWAIDSGKVIGSFAVPSRPAMHPTGEKLVYATARGAAVVSLVAKDPEDPAAVARFERKLDALIREAALPREER